ncbi:MAG: secretin N-terminal domain-containing protein, partial [Bythopirellula sp.]
MLRTPPTIRCRSSAVGVGLSLVTLLACLLAAPSPAFAQGSKKIRISLQSLTAETLHLRMQKVLRRKIATSQDPTGKWLGFNIEQAEGLPVTVWVSTEKKQAELSGPPQLVDSWQKVLALMDTPATDTNVTELIATKPGSQVKVRQAVQAIQAAQPTENRPAENPQSPLAGPELGTAAEPATAGNDSVEVSLLGPVQIEVVDGTDILLLRGNPRDVQRVLDVIEDIEQMSEVGEPEIEVVQLEHVESQALAVLLKQIFNENNSKYGYGSVGVYPLARPNSILLIALPTTMQRAKETLAKLDQPGKEATQFETSPLKHAKASDAVTIVQNLFSATETEDGTTPLAPKAQVIADSRTNSLIVRASPRDLAEVRALIAQIDLLGSQAINELRIFRLSSAVATDLEDVLQEAFQID